MANRYGISPLSPAGARTLALKERGSKVRLREFSPLGRFRPGDPLERLFPDILKGREIRLLAEAILAARREGRAFILGMGAHPVKVGVSPLLIDLMGRGVLTAVAANGAVAIHDIEVALAGETSEDVAAGLPRGAFGMAEETGSFYAEALRRAGRGGSGLGEVLGRELVRRRAPHLKHSLLAMAYRLRVPLTLHVTLGAEVTHMHPGLDPERLGRASYRDFLLLARLLEGLHEGGVFLNLGSAVVIPEVFLKALNLCRNLTGSPHHFTVADMDMTRHYRAEQNVLLRPVLGGHAAPGEGSAPCSFQLIGHHEIMVPLLYQMVRERLGRRRFAVGRARP